MPEFKERKTSASAPSASAWRPAIEAAMARKQFMPAPTDEEIAEMRAYGRTIVEPSRRGRARDCRFRARIPPGESECARDASSASALPKKGC